MHATGEEQAFRQKQQPQTRHGVPCFAATHIEGKRVRNIERPDQKITIGFAK